MQLMYRQTCVEMYIPVPNDSCKFKACGSEIKDISVFDDLLSFIAMLCFTVFLQNVEYAKESKMINVCYLGFHFMAGNCIYISTYICILKYICIKVKMFAKKRPIRSRFEGILLFSYETISL